MDNKQKLIECITVLADSLKNRAEDIADMTLPNRTRLIRIEMVIDTEAVPLISITAEQYPDRLVIPWERSE